MLDGELEGGVTWNGECEGFPSRGGLAVVRGEIFLMCEHDSDRPGRLDGDESIHPALARPDRYDQNCSLPNLPPCTLSSVCPSFRLIPSVFRRLPSTHHLSTTIVPPFNTTPRSIHWIFVTSVSFDAHFVISHLRQQTSRRTGPRGGPGNGASCVDIFPVRQPYGHNRSML